MRLSCFGSEYKVAKHFTCFTFHDLQEQCQIGSLRQCICCYFYFKTMCNKTMVRFGFCDIWNNQGLSSCYQLQPLARLITLTLDLIILDTTKTSSDNCVLFMHFQENMTYE